MEARVGTNIEDTSSSSDSEENDESTINNVTEMETQSSTDDSDLSDKEEEDSAEEDETETRTEIRKELSTLTFEELEALKSKLGIKVYNEAMFGSKSENAASSSRTKGKPKQFKRTNKNRPREISSKGAHISKSKTQPVKTKMSRDPRFDSSCGELDDTIWKTNYSFLTDVQKNEQEYLEQELKKETDEDRKQRIKMQIQRLKNKLRSTEAKKKDEEKVVQERLENKKRIQEGKNPFYMKKSTKKLVDLAEKYDQLKASGKLEKYLQKKREKNAKRDRKSVKVKQRTSE